MKEMGETQPGGWSFGLLKDSTFFSQAFLLDSPINRVGRFYLAFSHLEPSGENRQWGGGCESRTVGC